MTTETPASISAATGIEGLDHILSGGFPPNRVHLITGDPGSGKTTLALQFLQEGVKNGEKGLYVTLSETEEELLEVCKSHGFDLGGIDIFELTPSPDNLKQGGQYTMFHPSEVELNETTKAVLDQVDKLKPSRVVFDSLSEMRLLAQNPFRYRRQILALKQFFIGRNATVLLLDDHTTGVPEHQVLSIAHAAIHLEQLLQEYGTERRRLRVIKMRGKSYRGGYHDFRITTGGLEVYPRLVAAEHHDEFAVEMAESGLSELDKLLGGGLSHGSSTLLLGPAGCGKSSVGMQFCIEAAKQGKKSVYFAFDEVLPLIYMRSKGLGMDLQKHADDGTINLQQVDPAELSPGEFVIRVRKAVEEQGAKIVVIDSLNGYLNAMSEERFLTLQLHELLSYLNQLGVVTIMIVAQHGMVGSAISVPIDTSYLADTVVLFRYYETQGQVRQAISVLKKRGGDHEKTIRNLNITSEGLKVGDPIIDYRGILMGNPTYVSADGKLMS